MPRKASRAWIRSLIKKGVRSFELLCISTFDPVYFIDASPATFVTTG